MPKRTQYPIHAKLDLPESLRPETPQVDKWFQPLSEPVRRGAGVLAAAALLASGGIFDAEPSDFPVVYAPGEADGLTWSVPLNEPVRTVPIVPAALMPVVFDDLTIWPQQVTPFAPAVSQDSMVGAIQRTQYQAVAEPVLVEAPPVVVPEMDSWFRPLDEPVLPLPPRQTAGEAAPPAFFGPEVTSLDKWFQPPSEPVLPRFSGAHLWPTVQDANETLPSAEVITLDKWFQPLSEPTPPLTRSLAALDASGEVTDPDTLTRPEVTSLDKWYQPLSEPIRTTPPLPVGAIQSFEIDADSLTRPEATSLDKWFIPLSEPTRPVETFAHLWPTVSETVDILPSPEVVTLDKWYSPLSEPVPPRVTFAHLMAGAFDANETLPAPEVVAAFDADLRLGYHENVIMGGQPSLGGR